MFDTAIEAGVFQLSAPDTRWLSTGWDGGYHIADVAYNISVPEGWDEENIADYIAERRAHTGFDATGPTLLTGVDLQHARGARMGPVVVFATVGLSNPATLPMEDAASPTISSDGPTPAGTVNLVLGSSQPLSDGGLATLVTTAVEAKTAGLLSLAGFTGTTTDAVIAGSPAAGERKQWAGSGTELGNATRVCVRDALRASFQSRYADRPVPETVAEADHGVVTGGSAEVFQP